MQHDVDTVMETEERRFTSNRDTDCSFEANNEEGMPNWCGYLKAACILDKLVDVNGNGVQVPHIDFDDQPNMFETIGISLSPDSSITAKSSLITSPTSSLIKLTALVMTPTPNSLLQPNLPSPTEINGSYC